MEFLIFQDTPELNNYLSIEVVNMPATQVQQEKTLNLLLIGADQSLAGHSIMFKVGSF